MMTEGMRKRSQRTAYGAYVELYWRLMQLEVRDPARAALTEATRRAEARWRALMPPDRDTVLEVRGSVAVSAPAAPGAVTLARQELSIPTHSSVSLSAWGE